MKMLLLIGLIIMAVSVFGCDTWDDHWMTYTPVKHDK